MRLETLISNSQSLNVCSVCSDSLYDEFELSCGQRSRISFKDTRESSERLPKNAAVDLSGLICVKRVHLRGDPSNIEVSSYDAMMADFIKRVNDKIFTVTDEYSFLYVCLCIFRLCELTVS